VRPADAHHGRGTDKIRRLSREVEIDPRHAALLLIDVQNYTALAASMPARWRSRINDNSISATTSGSSS
jgi:class 3 adenylate cyclase